MKVKIKKVHQAWNMLYPNEFEVGDIVELEKNIVTSKNGRKFNADDLCGSFGCAYPDIFSKL